MADMFPILISKKFEEPSFLQAYKNLCKHLNDIGFFEHNCWTRLDYDSDYKNNIEKSADDIIKGKSKENIVIGEFTEESLGYFPSIYPYQYIPLRVAQKIRINDKWWILSNEKKIAPFLGVDIWVYNKYMEDTNIIHLKDRYNHRFNLPESMDNFPVEYLFTTDISLQPSH